MSKPAVAWNSVSMLTTGLKNLGNQINEWAPERYGDSDGALGDYRHTQEDSGHNPDDTAEHNAEWDGDSDNKPEIRAIDVDITFNNGVDAQTLVNHIVALKPSSVLRYIIYNRRIWEASNGWTYRPYTGASAHTEHIHFSGAYTNASDDNATFNYHLEEIPVALTSADKTWIANQIKANNDDLVSQLFSTPVVDSRNPSFSTRAFISQVVYGDLEAADKVINALAPKA